MAPVAGQWPGELHGRAVDALNGAPVAGASVWLPEAARRTVTDGAGGFRVRGLEPGSLWVHVEAPGYAPGRVRVEIRNGGVARADVELAPVPVPLQGIEADAASGRSAPGALRIDRRAIETSGARTAGDLLRALPGVTVLERGPGGSQTPSIRGSAADAVLVLLDGAPLNDPVTGEADLSTVPAPLLEEALVLPGALSARFGPRAQAGVVVLRSREAPERPGLSLAGGSLGWRALGAQVGGRARDALLWAAVQGEVLDGHFRFENPPETGGGRGRRRNADVAGLAMTAGARSGLAGGEVGVRVGAERQERGLAGRSFSPSDSARQSLSRLRVAGSWRADRPRSALDVFLVSSLQETRFHDPAPPFGLPYDERTRAVAASLLAETSFLRLAPWLPALGGGLAAELQRVDSGALRAEAPLGRVDAAGSVRAEVSLPGRETPELSLAARLHHDGAVARWHATHEVVLGLNRGPVALHAAHRSAFSPPTLGDQFFREGVGVAPNPDLMPERVPWEVEVGTTIEGVTAGIRGGAGLRAFRADVRDMIVWAPDFRFVWSPRNTDVRRDGLEARAEVGVPRTALRLSGSYSLVRITRDRPGAAPVQLPYRPRHSAGLRAAWDGPDGTLWLAGRFVGTRYPVAAPVNALPAFWSWDAGGSAPFTALGWRAALSLRIERLLDRRDSFIFGFPEPGRVVRLEVRVQPDP